MPEISEIELKSQIKENRYMTSYLIYGDEPYLKQHYVNLIMKKSVPQDMAGFNLRKFDVQNSSDIQEVMDATDTLPAFCEHTCTVVKDFPLDTIYSQDKKRFEEWIKEMPDTSIVVFWQDSADINPKKNAKWKNVIALFTKYSASVCLNKMDKASLAKTIMHGAKKRGCEIDKVTCFSLIETVGDDLNILLNETEKLCNYRKQGAITQSDIDAVCIKSLEANVFDLSKALINGNLSKCMSILNKLFTDKEKPELILGAIAGNFIDMYRVKVSVLSGKNADYLKNFYNYRNTEFRLRNAARDCSRLDIKDLRKCIDVLSKADKQIKLRVSDETVTLEKLIIELFSIVN